MKACQFRNNSIRQTGAELIGAVSFDIGGGRHTWDWRDFRIVEVLAQHAQAMDYG